MEGVVVQALLPVLQILAIRQVAQSSVTVPQSKFTGTAVRGKLRGASSGRQRLSQRVRSRCGLSVGALCLAVSAIHVSGSGELPGIHPSASQDANLPYPHLKFIREFSGASDVEKEAHPVLNRSLDIIAGPGDPRASIDRLEAPYAVTTDSAHRVFVTDPGAGVVHIFDFGQGKYALLGGKGSRIHSPSGIAIDGQGSVYISDSVEEAVLVYDARGKFQHYLGRAGRNESLFQAPAGIAIQEATGQIYVCDSRRHMVLVLDKKGHILSHIGKRWGGKGPAEFRYPSQIRIAGEELFVLDRGNSRVQILDMGGHFRREIKMEEVHTDAGLALDEEKNIYVSDPQFSGINVFAYDGRFLYRFGRNGTKAGDFDTPSGLWVEAGKGLYVADTKNKRVEEFQIEAQPGAK